MSENPDKIYSYKEFAFLNAKRIKKLVLNRSFEENYSLMVKELPERSLNLYLDMNLELAERKENPNLTKLLKTFTWLKYSPESRMISIPSGNYTISNKMVIPEGYTFHISKGTTIEFEKDSFIHSRSPIIALGSSQDPINIRSKEKNGNGLAIILPVIDKFSSKNEFPFTSKLSYVNFQNLSSPKMKGWAPTGAVTFYGGKVDIDNSTFQNNFSEDSLNIVLSEVQLSNSQFDNSFSDALDIDFGKGTLKKLVFRKTKNDSLDFSGSELSLKQIEIFNSKDKGISIGEKSSITAENISITNSEICLADKDGSFANVKNLSLNNCKVGLALYEKKPEYGPSTLKVSNLKLQNVKKKFQFDDGFKLYRDEELLKKEKIGNF